MPGILELIAMLRSPDLFGFDNGLFFGGQQQGMENPFLSDLFFRQEDQQRLLERDSLLQRERPPPLSPSVIEEIERLKTRPIGEPNRFVRLL